MLVSVPADLDPANRRRIARRAVDEMGGDRDGRVVLRVRCGRGHHVAAVYDTALGPVFESQVGHHAHGERDFVDTAHHARADGGRYTDLLAADRFADDLLPAGCECGAHELSRAEMRRAIDAGHHLLRVA